MHEMSLAEGILQLVEATALREKARTVKLVVVEIGKLSTVEPEALDFCFDAVTRGSIAQGAALEMVRVDGVAWCMECAKSVPMQELFSACPQCGSYQMQVTAGTEMRVREIEID
jgi:hydrogenase nickel incorporation protein HypA/HybF